MRQLITVAAGMLAAFLMPGCLTAAVEVAKEGASGIRGPQGIFREIQPISASALGACQRFEMSKFQDDFGGQVPPEVFGRLPEYFGEYLRTMRVPNGRVGKTIVVSGKIIYYEEQHGSRTILSPLEEIIARVELIDKDSGHVVGVAVCVGRTTARLHATSLRRKIPDELDMDSGAAIMARGLAKAIADWIVSRYPKLIR
jgi:hypothetical protein